MHRTTTRPLSDLVAVGGMGVHNKGVCWYWSSRKTQVPECQAEDLLGDRLGREPGLSHSYQLLSSI